jgi:hypothetical protein
MTFELSSTTPDAAASVLADWSEEGRIMVSIAPQ